MRKFLACSLVGIAVFGGVLVACSGGGGRSQKAFCDALKNDANVLDSLLNSSAPAALDDLANKAPDEIKDDMAKVAQYTKDTVAKKQSSVSAQDVAAAAVNINKYAKDKCGIDLTSSLSSSGSNELSSLSSSLSDRFSDLSDLSNLTDLSQFSDLSSLSSNLSDLGSLSDLTSAFSSLLSR